MFAGPNGSGKSTLKRLLDPELLGIYLNPDDIEREMRRDGFLDLRAFGVGIGTDEVREFFRNSTLLRRSSSGDFAGSISIAAGRMEFERDAADSYVASVMVDLFRQRLLAAKATFTFETVMSHRSKVDFLERAQSLGYRTYLYFIATDNPAINESRVKTRVAEGGHSVPVDKINKRYHESLNLLIHAVRRSNRAFIFDNSGDGEEKTWLAEVTEGTELAVKADPVPAWFKSAVLDKFSKTT